MNSYKCSDGTRVTQRQIDDRVIKAKRQVLDMQFYEIGYNVCTDCMQNNCIPIDCAHLISVDKAKKQGKTEQCWNVFNIIPLGRKCHQKRDKLNLQFK